jgi:hypothetical protein
MNASLATIRAGLKPVHVLKATDRDYFLFLVKRVSIAGRIVNRFQYRRELGEGHSREERAARRAKRNADYRLRREYKRARKLEAAA